MSNNLKNKIVNLAKANWFFVFALFLILLFLWGYKSVKGDFDSRVKESRIKIYIDDEVLNIKTSQPTLIEALTEGGIKIYEEDALSLPRDISLTGVDYSVRVERSVPIVINNDGKKIFARSVYKNPKEVLNQNNIKYWPEDIIKTELILNPVYYSGAGRLISIERAPVYYINVDRKKIEIRDWDGEVGNIIKKAGVALNPNDIVHPNKDAKLTNGAEINITRINYAEIVEKKSISYQTTYQGSTSIPLGQERVRISGVTGEKKLTYRVTYKDGKEVSRILIGDAVTRPKRDAIILRGSVTGKCKWGQIYEKRDGPYTTAFHYALSNRSYIGRYILVTNLSNRKNVKVRVVDAGPTNGLLDLSTTAIKEIGGLNSIYVSGYFNVSVQLL
ncbi:MAG: G5 domain-containing protein [Patescibacteria group bacterium]|nr:G5 domain-containing protein [Patescibacteria group bacterium]